MTCDEPLSLGPRQWQHKKITRPFFFLPCPSLLLSLSFQPQIHTPGQPHTHLPLWCLLFHDLITLLACRKRVSQPTITGYGRTFVPSQRALCALEKKRAVLSAGPLGVFARSKKLFSSPLIILTRSSLTGIHRGLRARAPAISWVLNAERSA